MSKDLSVRSNWLSASSPSNTQLEVAHSKKVSSSFIGRWSLSKLLRPMDYRDFAAITQKFYHSASEAFGTKCDIEITAHKVAPITTSFYDPGLEAMIKEANNPNLLIEIPSLLAYIKQIPQNSSRNALARYDDRSLPVQDKLNMERIWNEAGFVQVSIKPLNKDATAQSAWANIEFKGKAPRHASFYVQPYGEEFPYAQKVAGDMRTWAKGLHYSEEYREHRVNVNSEIANFKFGFHG